MSHNKESLKKILFYFLITVGLVFSSTSYAGLNPNSWTELCDTNNEGEKVNCSIGVNSLMTASDGKQNVTASIQVLKGVNDKKKNVTIINVAVPLNVDLRKSPQIFVDENFVLKITYRTCNSSIGCKAIFLLNEELISKFKKGKNLNLIFFGYGIKNPYRINFPLKNFTKAYKEL
jgi:invasion protein IalB